MFTQWQQVEDWINNSQLEHWIFTRSDRNNRSAEGGAPNDKILDSDYFPGDKQNKLQLTKQSLEQYGAHAYGFGWNGKKCTDGLYCDVQLIGTGISPMNGVPMIQQQPAFDKEAYKKEILNEIKLQQYEEERKNFEAEKREFEKKVNGAFGLAINYLTPIVQAFNKKNVAGVDAEAPVIAPPVPLVPAAPEVPEEESPFTDEEEDQILDLLTRFKKVEPDYMRLLESVVKLAESGDGMYTTAKGFLIK